MSETEICNNEVIIFVNYNIGAKCTQFFQRMTRKILHTFEHNISIINHMDYDTI